MTLYDVYYRSRGYHYITELLYIRRSYGKCFPLTEWFYPICILVFQSHCFCLSMVCALVRVLLCDQHSPSHQVCSVGRGRLPEFLLQGPLVSPGFLPRCFGLFQATRPVCPSCAPRLGPYCVTGDFAGLPRPSGWREGSLVPSQAHQRPKDGGRVCVTILIELPLLV